MQGNHPPQCLLEADQNLLEADQRTAGDHQRGIKVVRQLMLTTCRLEPRH
jgi:hypothetical protein